MIVEALTLGYLIGSIPFALLLPRHAAGVDVRRVGSGNPGAANVLRSAGARLGVSVLALDAAKGISAVLLAGRLGADLGTASAAGFASIVGHVFPVWLRFRGGKGVATTCGVFAILAPVATAAAAAVFVLTIWITRYISLGSLVASLTLAPLAYWTHAAPPAVVAAVAASILIVHRHRENVRRLKTGTERRFGVTERIGAANQRGERERPASALRATAGKAACPPKPWRRRMGGGGGGTPPHTK
ncbi:MAG: glycerol-3-phosphate 1-O-acyltransferase PlsY [Acidobacteria bacterium]|nr:glycerol-3-phosphate 1-O-acyltransferase PlsY [Acidobacteriota bacterium]